jgi:hypothetical protein
MAFRDEGSSVSARSGSDPAKREEAYGPLRFRRYVKSDGRALILYTRERPSGDASTPRGEMREGETQRK